MLPKSTIQKRKGDKQSKEWDGAYSEAGRLVEKQTICGKCIERLRRSEEMRRGPSVHAFSYLLYKASVICRVAKKKKKKSTTR